MEINEGKRWSGADWATEIKGIYLIGVGGIGSWTALNLARIGHSLSLIDGDIVDSTNVGGGQMFRTKDIGRPKAEAVHEICREFGCAGVIDSYESNYNEEDFGCSQITICGVDNMAARRQIFTAWRECVKNSDEEDCAHYLFIDGRLLLENMEIFCIQGWDVESMDKYEKEHLFDDSEVPDLDCTTKQVTFSAMTIAGLITSTLCNWLTNMKIGADFRSVPFYQRMYLPIFQQTLTEAKEEVVV